MRGVIAVVVGLLLAAAALAGEQWKAPASAKGVKNPVAKAEGLKGGKEFFAVNCVLCHGEQGKGDGPAGTSLTPRPKNLGEKAIQAQTDGELYWKISEGRGMMPGFKSLPEKERWSLVHYIRSFAAAKK